ncbi:hypothetical protein GIB67_017455 [Kingdonia uniflora]|uniref:Plastocyanin-like domain-containing protein n=1 Tax=Kingdonia uniflora TaxID=39325 RepID=A0A7J7M4E9_9MAGN|nr:hypothetical protein GIB67_017455 [Kingdonia uniflora]
MAAIHNLHDPPYRNTVGVPVGGWAVIRFRADNPEYYTDFPDKPDKMYDSVNGAPNNMGVDTQPLVGTQVSVIEYEWNVQVIFQDTGTVGTENHPVHLHGSLVHALPSRSPYELGPVDGFYCEER